MERITQSKEETQQLASDFLNFLNAKRSTLNAQRATVLALFGDLGSGKTTFVQGLARALGIEEQITSPTFVIQKTFKLSDFPKFKHLIHIDAYRLEKGEELRHLGFDELAAEPENLIVIEWPERVADILPPDVVKINFEFLDEKRRKITW